MTIHPLFANKDLSLHWLEDPAWGDDKIAILTLKSIARASIDRWFQTIKDITSNWPHDNRLLMIYDVTQISLTPYFRERAFAATPLTQGIPGAYVVLVNKSALAQAMRLFVRREVSTATAGRESRIFTEQEEAIAWLLSLGQDEG